MIFPLISKFSAELVKSYSGYARDNVTYEPIKHSRTSNSKANLSDRLRLLSYQQLSLAC